MDDCWHTFSPHDRRRAAGADPDDANARVMSPCLDCGRVVDLLLPAPAPQDSALFDLQAAGHR